MPTKKQIDNNRNTANFLPVLGGTYGNGNPIYEAIRGFWWGNEMYNGAFRYNLYYNTVSLLTGNLSGRFYGFYIRCVSEEKTVLDLTYMQDMTLSISSLLPPPRL